MYLTVGERSAENQTSMFLAFGLPLFAKMDGKFCPRVFDMNDAFSRQPDAKQEADASPTQTRSEQTVVRGEPKTGARGKSSLSPASVHSSHVDAPTRAPTLEEQLFAEGFAFDFFQAVRILEKLQPDRCPVGRTGPAQREVVRFRAHQSLSFPASAIYDVQPSPSGGLPVMTVTFLGLTGPSGVLPRHYTELLLNLERDTKGPEKHVLRAWLDLFNHRMISLFFRAWEKYRFYIPFERGEHADVEPDAFTQALFSLIGLGLPPLRNRLGVSIRQEDEKGEPREKILARVDDLALLHYSGFLSHRPRCAVALEAMLEDYFQLPIKVQQFQGQWFQLDEADQSHIGGNCQLGVNVVAGSRVWDVQGKMRLRVGPLRYAQFTELLPDRSPMPKRKIFFLLVHLTRLYVGPEFDLDIQLVLRKEDIPACQLSTEAGGAARLGWNTWIYSQPCLHDADDAVFPGEEVVTLK